MADFNTDARVLKEAQDAAAELLAGDPALALPIHRPLLEKVRGLFEENPKDNPDAKIIPLVTEIDDHIRSIAGGAGSNRGTGGMATKIAAAEICFSCGCSMAIINSSRFETLYDILEGKQVGTLFERR